MLRRLAVPLSLVLLFAATATHAAPRRRAVPTPATPDTQSVAGWLAANAAPLASTELIASTNDLERLRSIVGTAPVVGLGDGTHGTHEFYTVKLRIIDFLVRNLDFDVLAFEGAFPLFEKINVYVQGGAGDPRALLAEARALDYVFWDVEELLAVIEWARDYNLHRGARPPLEIAGADVFDAVSAATAVVQYLGRVDPGLAGSVQSDYSCVKPGVLIDSGCRIAAQRALGRITPRRDEFVAVTGARAYDDAVQYATVVEQMFTGIGGSVRDAAMARNALWIRDHRGTSRKMIVWGHQEHVANLPAGSSGRSMGANLRASLGSDYFVIGTLGGTGTFGAWKTAFETIAMPAIPAGSYESLFRESGRSALLIPLRGAVPQWLAGPHLYRGADRSGLILEFERSLPQIMDAVVYVERTTAVKPLVH